MKKILYIYKTDLQRIGSNWAAAVIIGGLVVLPSLYAWFNILASWDPYGQTGGLRVAVANSDKGAVIASKSVNVGRQIVDSLRNNRNIGWVFTTPEKARDGVRRGEFYASIEIPENFSQRIASVLTDNPQKGEILYEVNEKINAVAPKITAKGASSIVEEVSKNFVETANGAIFKIFNEIGVELQEQLPLIERLTALVSKLAGHFPEINEAAAVLVRDLTESGGVIAKTQAALPEAADLADKGAAAAETLADFLAKNKGTLAAASPAVKAALAAVQDTAARAGAAAAALQSLPLNQSSALPGDQTQNAVRDAVRDAVQDAMRDPARDAGGDVAQDAIPDAGPDTGRDPVNDAAGRDKPQDAVQDAVRGAARDATQGATRNAVQNPAQDAARNAVQNAAQDAAKDAAGLLVNGEAQLAAAAESASSLSELLARLAALDEGAPHSAVLSGAAQQAADLADKLGRLDRLNRALLTAAQQGAAIRQADLAEFAKLSADIGAAAGDLLDRYDSEIAPAIQQAADNASAAASEAADLLMGAKQTLPQVASILNDAAAGVKTATAGARALQEQLPAAEQKIGELASRLQSMEKEGDLQKLIDLLQLNFQKESQFFAEPVVLKEQDLFPIPNYGSAMSPFFTTLSLWVGGLLLVSLLTVDVDHPHPGENRTPLRSYQIYFGRYLTFATLAVLQSLFVTTGDLLLLRTYAADPFWFVLFGAILSLVFMLMIYTLVSVFGNVGKAMAIVLLVLQLAGSGGTFPIQVTPPFFQAIYPFLPFTYAIRIMREAVGGILWDVVARSLPLLALFAAGSLVIGVGLKEIINAKAARLVKKAKESRLIH